MPWYQVCSNRGYTKFYSNPELREDRWIVSDAYLQSLLTAYRQGYKNAGGPDYEDSDDRLLDILAENCVGGASDAASLGARDAARDKAAGQEYHTESLSPGGAIPETAPIGTPSTTIYTTQGNTNPVGQPTGYVGGSLGAEPSNATSGPSSAFGYGVSGVGSGGGGGLLGGGGGIPWLLILAIGAGIYFLTRK